MVVPVTMSWEAEPTRSPEAPWPPSPAFGEVPGLWETLSQTKGRKRLRTDSQGDGLPTSA